MNNLNPMLNLLNQSGRSLPLNLNKIKQYYNMIQNSNNPQGLLQSIIQNNPNMQGIMNYVNQTTWFSVDRSQVDAGTRQAAVKTGLQKWVTWERETKKSYEKAYLDLMSEDEVAAALFVKGLVLDVQRELEKAQKYWLCKKAMAYDMPSIISEQKECHDKYKKNMIKLFQ